MELPLRDLDLDFNEERKDGLIPALSSDLHGLGRPEPGEFVLARDADGNRCLAVIDSTKGRLLYVRPMWDTWATAPVVVVRYAPFEFGEASPIPSATPTTAPLQPA
jgi:hypothetical protein